MSEVYNWHLGRPMNYRFESGATQRQFAAVFNINRCIACQTCTMACKSTWTHSPGQELMWWNNVETKPYGSYPNGWDVKALGLLEDANPGGQVWDGAPGDGRAPYGRFDGVTVFEATDGFTDHVAGYLPAEEEWKAPNRFEDHATRFPTSRTSRVVLLSRPDLQSLFLSGMPGILSSQRHLQTTRRRNRPRRPGTMPWLPQVR